MNENKVFRTLISNIYGQNVETRSLNAQSVPMTNVFLLLRSMFLGLSPGYYVAVVIIMVSSYLEVIRDGNLACLRNSEKS